MSIPYRTRQVIKQIFLVLLVIVLVLALLGVGFFIWLRRFVIYTRDGAFIRTNLPPMATGWSEVTVPELGDIEILYKEYGEEDDPQASTELTQLIGYYADTEALQDMEAVRTQAALLEEGTAVMLDVKDAKGRFYYPSALNSERVSAIDAGQMEALIRQLDDQGLYLIARLPALRDYHFGLTQTQNGLFVSSGQYLWADDDYCYWLDPTKEGTQMYLVQIVNELKALGFDEVVFEEFRFPDTDNLKFSRDRGEALTEAAEILMASCATDTFAVSFVGGAAGFKSPAGRGRLYITGAVAADAARIAAESGVADPKINLVFLTEFHDTRFNDYSVLRPIESAE